MKFALYGFFFEQTFSFNVFKFYPEKYDLRFWTK